MAKVTVNKKPKAKEKLSVSIGFVISETINKKLEKEMRKIKAKNKSDLLRQILDTRYAPPEKQSA